MVISVSPDAKLSAAGVTSGTECFLVFGAFPFSSDGQGPSSGRGAPGQLTVVCHVPGSVDHWAAAVSGLRSCGTVAAEARQGSSGRNLSLISAWPEPVVCSAFRLGVAEITVGWPES